MTTYSEKFKDPRWQKKRLEILTRDNWTCQVCKSTDNTLHVHHKMYLNVENPWEYDNDLLVCLCEECHEIEGELKKEYEKLFLENFYKSGFLADDLRTLSHLFSYIKTSKIKKVKIYKSIEMMCSKFLDEYNRIVKL